MFDTIQFKADDLVECKDCDIHPKLIEVLHHEMHINLLYDMQFQMISFITRNDALGNADDIILCAPTGSGKTLAYALPIVQHLHDRIVPSLNAIVVVPTRDLATQVFHVFAALAKPFSLSVAVITGASSIAEEKSCLIDCDILIATPGRLVDHVYRGDSISLENVTCLVLDESDRLLQESYDRWLQIIMPKLGKIQTRFDIIHGVSTKETESCGDDVNFSDEDVDEAYWRPSTGMLSLALVPSVASRARSAYGTTSDETVRKILVSATQELDPTRMVYLDIRDPVIVQAASRSENEDDSEINNDKSLSVKYVVPTSLIESGFVVKKAKDKPAALLSLLGWTAPLPASQVENIRVPVEQDSVKLVFTNSIDSAHKITRLLELAAYDLKIPVRIFEMSGELSASRRRFVVDQAKRPLTHLEEEHDGNVITIIVCSDLLSRGMDILNVDCVINYDIPSNLRTYLHRAGRTARAGRAGAVATILLKHQARYFRGMMEGADRGNKSVRIFDMKSNVFFTTSVTILLSKALSLLKKVLHREKLNLLNREMQLPVYALTELYCRLRTESRDWDDEKIASIVDENSSVLENFEEHEKKRKRPSSEELSHDCSDQETIEAEKTTIEEVFDGDDDLSDLLYAQIARSLMADGS